MSSSKYTKSKSKGKNNTDLINNFILQEVHPNKPLNTFGSSHSPYRTINIALIMMAGHNRRENKITQVPQNSVLLL